MGVLNRQHDNSAEEKLDPDALAFEQEEEDGTAHPPHEE